MRHRSGGNTVAGQLLAEFDPSSGDGLRTAAEWSAIVPRLAQAWFDHCGHPVAAVLVTAGFDHAITKRLHTAALFAQYLAATVDAIGKALNSKTRRAVLGDAPMRFGIDLDEGTLRDRTRGSYTRATIESPWRIAPTSWRTLAPDLQQKNTTTTYAETLRAVRSAWEPLPRSSDLEP